MILYNRFLLNPIGNAPLSHLLSKKTTYLGTPHLIIGESIMFTETPEKDVLNIEDLAAAYENLAEELLKNRAYPKTYTHTPVNTWYYPIPEEKYITTKFERIKRINDTELSKVPVEKPPTIKIHEYDTPPKPKIVPHIITVSETIHGITTTAEITLHKNTLTATLIPPDLGMSTPLYLSTVQKKYKNQIIKELVEKYLDGLEIPTSPRIKTTNEKWEGKRAMLKTTYVKIIKLLIHTHKNVYSDGCEPLKIHFYST